MVISREQDGGGDYMVGSMLEVEIGKVVEGKEMLRMECKAS